MVRKLTIAAAAVLLSSAAYAQGPMHETWDINAPNGEPMALGHPLPTHTGFSASAPMHETWDINAPNGEATFAAVPEEPAQYADTDVHGHAAATSRADRVIEVHAGMGHVNVTSGETVLFKVGNRAFAWTFEPTLAHPSFDISEIAPHGVAVRGVRIYCAPDQYERAS